MRKLILGFRRRCVCRHHGHRSALGTETYHHLHPAVVVLWLWFLCLLLVVACPLELVEFVPHFDLATVFRVLAGQHESPVALEVLPLIRVRRRLLAALVHDDILILELRRGFYSRHKLLDQHRLRAPHREIVLIRGQIEPLQRVPGSKSPRRSRHHDALPQLCLVADDPEDHMQGRRTHPLRRCLHFLRQLLLVHLVLFNYLFFFLLKINLKY